MKKIKQKLREISIEKQMFIVAVINFIAGVIFFFLSNRTENEGISLLLERISLLLLVFLGSSLAISAFSCYFEFFLKKKKEYGE